MGKEIIFEMDVEAKKNKKNKKKYIKKGPDGNCHKIIKRLRQVIKCML